MYMYVCVYSNDGVKVSDSLSCVEDIHVHRYVVCIYVVVMNVHMYVCMYMSRLPGYSKKF
jgi:hypothetical protein